MNLEPGRPIVGRLLCSRLERIESQAPPHGVTDLDEDLRDAYQWASLVLVWSEPVDPKLIFPIDPIPFTDA